MSLRSRAWTAVSIRFVVGLAAAATYSLTVIQPAAADNCSALSDCSAVVGIGLVVLGIVGVGVLIALGAGLLGAGAIAAEEAAAAAAVAGEEAAATAAEATAEAAAQAAAESEAAAVAAAEAAAEQAAAEAAGEQAAAEAAQAAREAQQAVDFAEVDPNKLAHIFDNPGHNWDLTGLDQAGNLDLIEQAIAENWASLPEDGLFRVSLDVGGRIVQVSGKVVGGVIRIGSAWVVP